MKKIIIILAIIGIVLLASCTRSALETSGGKTTSGKKIKQTAKLPDAYTKFNAGVSVSVDGDYVIVKSNGIPNHKSCYFSFTDTMYETYNGSNPYFMRAPNTIRKQSYTFKIPINPTEASKHSATNLGPIGVALNGIPLFNQYNGFSMPLTNEYNSFDQYNGHPQQFGGYHYHIEPSYLTAKNGKESLVGFLLDGFPVYGPEENGKSVTNSELDIYHGHFAPTADYPEGIYHYHFTNEAPYLNGAGYYGTPGRVTE